MPKYWNLSGKIGDKILKNTARRGMGSTFIIEVSVGYDKSLNIPNGKRQLAFLKNSHPIYPWDKSWCLFSIIQLSFSGLITLIPNKSANTILPNNIESKQLIIKILRFEIDKNILLEISVISIFLLLHNFKFRQTNIFLLFHYNKNSH